MSERHGNKADLKAIDRIRIQHVGALNEGNAEGWVAVFADDGVQMPPNAPANVGKDMIRTWSLGLLSGFGVKFDLSVDEVRVLGDWAFECGVYTISLYPVPTGPTIEDTGNYITVYQRTSDDTWKVARDIWNSSLPLPQS